MTWQAMDAALVKLNMTSTQALSNIGTVIPIVSYHVVLANVLKAADLKDGQKITTMLLNGVLTVNM